MIKYLNVNLNSENNQIDANPDKFRWVLYTCRPLTNNTVKTRGIKPINGLISCDIKPLIGVKNVSLPWMSFCFCLLEVYGLRAVCPLSINSIYHQENFLRNVKPSPFRDEQKHFCTHKPLLSIMKRLRSEHDIKLKSHTCSLFLLQAQTDTNTGFPLCPTHSTGLSCNHYDSCLFFRAQTPKQFAMFTTYDPIKESLVWHSAMCMWERTDTLFYGSGSMFPEGCLILKCSFWHLHSSI